VAADDSNQMPGQHARIAPFELRRRPCFFDDRGIAATADRRISHDRAACRPARRVVGQAQHQGREHQRADRREHDQRRRQAKRFEDEKRSDRRADDRAEPVRRGDRGKRCGPLLTFGAGGDIGLHRRRRGRAERSVKRAAEHEDHEYGGCA
jgi:hypothetical protein